MGLKKLGDKAIAGLPMAAQNCTRMTLQGC
jgi:hypothetical protein